MNKIVLTGRLAQEPDLKRTQNGTEVCTFTVAVQRNFRNANGQYDTDFINCKTFKGQANFVHQYFHKGSWIEVEGALQIHSYEGNDGVKRWMTEVVCDRAGFVGARSDANQVSPIPPVPRQNAAQAKSEPPAATQTGFTEYDVDEDDLPF